MSKPVTPGKRAAYIIQAGLIRTMMGLFRILPVSLASATGGAIARFIGPFLPATHRARTNLAMALPEQAGSHKDIIKGMWANIGRTLAEYPHLGTLAAHNTIIEGRDILERLKASDQPAILFSAHLANWEIPGACMALNGIDLDLVYRAPNNLYVQGLLNRARSLNGRIGTIPKSDAGTRQLVKSLRQDNTIGILIDQKYNRGLSVPFFGHEAMTSTAFLQLAWKYDCPLVPVRIERLTGANFRLTLHEPIRPAIDEGSNTEFQQDAARIHTMLEDWIRQRPEQWLWLHRRWPKDIYKDNAK